MSQRPVNRFTTESKFDKDFDRMFDRMEANQGKVVKSFVLIWIASAIISIAGVIALVWVAAHFISKFW